MSLKKKDAKKSTYEDYKEHIESIFKRLTLFQKEK